MIFVYPAIVSNKVDTKIAPAVCKTLEQFFLSHLAEAFQSGTLRVKTEFDKSNDVYGALKLENKKIVGRTFLTEAGKSNDPAAEISNDVTIYEAEVSKFEDKYNDSRVASSNFLGDTENKETLLIKRHTVNELINRLIELKNFGNSLLKKIDTTLDDPSYNDARIANTEDVEDLIKRVSKPEHDLKTKISLINDIDKKLPKSDDKFEHEKGKEKLSQFETHGSYKVETMKGVSLKPTMMNLTVKIHYVGGPHEVQGAAHGADKEIAVGCKILPMSLSNFDSIENAILNDYFATSQQMLWRRLYRSFLRASLGIMDKILHKLGLSDEIEGPRSKMSPVQSEVLLAPQGYINASSFRNKPNTPNFYNYSSAIVIFNKDDIMKEEGSNFFLDKHQLAKMFKAGWNSFCILDPLREEAMFITALDGGYLHTIPYSFIFNNLGMDQIYTNINDLQRRSPVFRKKAGTFSTLVSKLRRESSLLSVVKNYLTEKKDGARK